MPPVPGPTRHGERLGVDVTGLDVFAYSIADFLCASKKVTQPLWALANDKAS